jgi:uncharacterized coiled-coil protein SlyX
MDGLEHRMDKLEHRMGNLEQKVEWLEQNCVTKTEFNDLTKLIFQLRDLIINK